MVILLTGLPCKPRIWMGLTMIILRIGVDLFNFTFPNNGGSAMERLHIYVDREFQPKHINCMRLPRKV